MGMNLSVTEDGKLKISTRPKKMRIESLDKWLGRNRDALLVKLDGDPDPSASYKPGHLSRIEEDNVNNRYNVFVGSHFVGCLPEEAIEFAKNIDYYPEILISIIGKVEYNESGDCSGVYIYIAE